MAGTKQVKKASSNVMKERMKAFDYGMDLYYEQTGINKAAAAQAVGLKESAFAPRAAAWLKEKLAEANKQASTRAPRK